MPAALLAPDVLLALVDADLGAALGAFVRHLPCGTGAGGCCCWTVAAMAGGGARCSMIDVAVHLLSFDVCGSQKEYIEYANKCDAVGGPTVSSDVLM